MNEPNYANIKLLIMDVDGVLTDGGIVIHSDGTESKRFHVIDGHRIKMWQRAGLETAIISGRETACTTLRAEQLGITHVIQGALEKLPALEELLVKLELTVDQVACVGDDLMDMPLVKRAGLGVAVANAAEELKHVADYITTRPGGCGAVAEVIESILKKSQRWEPLMQRYRV